MEFTNMITRQFTIDINSTQLSYYVGMDQFILKYDEFLIENNIKNEDKTLQVLINKISQIQNGFAGSSIQLLDNNYLLNARHLFLGAYFMQKAFQYGINISNKRNIELLLYLTARRQIKRALNTFGLKISELNKGSLTFCIISPKNNLGEIKNQILSQISTKSIKRLNINDLSVKKLEGIRNFFKITNQQIQVLFRAYNHEFSGLREEGSLQKYAKVLGDLIAEKMAKLSLEKVNLS
ncbi:MAG: KEOPS complex subunit Cgi121 [Promethearchaeia archaeon]